MGARAFVGEYGGSKTLGLTEWLQAGVDKQIDATTNYGYVNGSSFASMPELAAILHARLLLPYADRRWLRIGIDEPGLLFPCRGQSQFPPVLEAICNRARHYKVELGYAVPNITRVDVSLRLATSRIVRCTSWFPKTITHDLYGEITRPRVVSMRERKYADDKIGDHVHREWYRWGRLSHLVDLYDSFGHSVAELAELERIASDTSGKSGSWGMAGPDPVAPVAAVTGARAPRTHRARRTAA